MTSSSSIASLVLARCLPLDGHALVVLSLASIKLSMKNRLKRKKKEKQLDSNKVESSAIVVCLMEQSASRQELKRK